VKTPTLDKVSYATEPRDLDDVLAALDAMAVEALTKLVLAPAHFSAVHPEHARIHGLLNAVADLRVALKVN
jgi:hypothetical protein